MSAAFPFAFWKSSASVFDPATLSLTGWWRGSFSASPWVGTASAGSSGTRDLTEGTNAPASGSAVNGFNPADFDGTNDELSNATTMGTLLSASAWMAWVLFWADGIDTSNADATAYNNDALICDAGQFWGIHLRNTPTVQIYQWDGAAKVNAHAISTGAWNLICARYDGTNLRSSLNGGAITSLAAGNITTTTHALKVGENAAGSPSYLDGKILDIGMMASAGSDANITTDIKAYVNSRYNLAL